MASLRYDVAIVGAGPVGGLCALAHARKGARTALLEANPKASTRLAGEWLHPPAVQMLRDFGVRLDSQLRSSVGQGFLVFPEDGSDPIVLPYPNGSRGLVCEHQALVRHVDDERVVFSRGGSGDEPLWAERIVGADGRTSIVRRSLGVPAQRMTCSRMLGVSLEGESLEPHGYGQVLLGGPGPILVYPLGERCVRIVVDVPLTHWSPGDQVGAIADCYAGFLPEAVRSAFVAALHAGEFRAATNELQPRFTYGSSRRVLIGDAAGHYHPITAVGMTLGFGDALALAEVGDFKEFTAKRFTAIRAPELLAIGLYEVFADHRFEAVALRHAIYGNWRSNRAVRDRTMRLLACEDTSVPRLGLAMFATVIRAVAGAVPPSLDHLAWRRAANIVYPLAGRLRWFFRGVRKLQKARRADDGRHQQQARDLLARAFSFSMAPADAAAGPHRPKEISWPDVGPAFQSASKRLLDAQGDDGAWEGEVVWCPMLTAQYVLLHHIMGQPIDAGRRRRILRSFECTRLADGVWGLHEHSPPHLFVTTLVYVAARLVGADRDDPLVEPARRFLQSEGVVSISSWGKFWLALLNLYDWRGVNAIMPELWSLPHWLPLHPSNWYCHTRLIYMAMASIYPHRFQMSVTPLIESLREELFPEGFANVDFSAGRNRLREADMFARPGVWLRAAYRFALLYETVHGKHLRDRSVELLIRQIRWELRTTRHASISPVSGFLNILALWLRDPHDADCRQALAKLDDWIWEDEERGMRVTGARSVSWDTGLALQALATASERNAVGGVRDAVRRGAEYLRQQQVGVRFEGFRKAYRTDPRGGWCFPGAWHGWPVSDCTAEALLGILASGVRPADTAMIHDAVRFMLRCQNRDGGFGSYEARRSRLGLEWLNPAEMFGESMTERSFVECTASCIAALAACRRHEPKLADEAVTGAISRAATWLRRTQARDGSWRGVWGVQFIYGTLFGIRGLVASGTRPGDPALLLASRWLLDRQRDDGGWGEHHSGCRTGRYVSHSESQVIQTAWALIALIEAGDLHWTRISHGIRFLLSRQDANGEWPKQDMAGVFFRTALLDYVLYRQYFPLHALALYGQKRQDRLDSATHEAGRTRAAS